MNPVSHTPNTSHAWNDFNDAEAQAGFDLIPKGTLVKVHLTIKPGGFDEPSQGWTGGWATLSEQTGSVYLNAEFVVLDGPYVKRKLWSLIGLYSPKGDEWANMGRSFIRAMLNSARGIDPKDTSQEAQVARRIAHFGELDGLEFVGRVDIEQDSRGDDKNTIRQAVEPGHKDYAALMAGGVAGPVGASSPTAARPSGFSGATAAVAAPARHATATSTPVARTGVSKPSWAQ